MYIYIWRAFLTETGRWAKGRFKEAGLGDIPLWKISGNLPVEWKVTVMERFCTRYIGRDWCFPPHLPLCSTNGILFSTDAAAMGVNIPQLCIGVSLGELWKLSLLKAITVDNIMFKYPCPYSKFSRYACDEMETCSNLWQGREEVGWAGHFHHCYSREAVFQRWYWFSICTST